WGAMLGFLLFLYAATEVIHTFQMSDLAGDRHRATAAIATFVDTGGAVGRIVGAVRSGRGYDALVADIDEMDASLAPMAEHGLTDNLTTLARETRARIAELKRAANDPQGPVWDRALATFVQTRADLGKVMAAALQVINDRQDALFESHRQNKLLI